MGLAQIKMPQLGESVTEGTVEKWLKSEGDFVKRDEPLVEVVTDKVNAEIPSPFEGKLVKIAVTEGETVRVGAVLGQIEVAGAATAADPAAAATPPPTKKPAAPDEEVPAEPAVATAPRPATATPVAAPPAVPAASSATGSNDRARLSPAVRKLAAEHGIEATALRGTGMGGRVTRDDVLAAVDGGAAAAAAPAPDAPTGTPAPAGPRPAPADGAREEVVKRGSMRRAIAEHVTSLVRYREAEKDGFRARHGASLTYLPFVIQIVCDAIKQYPWLNSTWSDEGVVLKHYINMGIAVSIPDGLIVPVLKDADQRGFTDLVRSINDLVERARSKQLKPDDVQGGTFTLNNTGSTGSVASQPIINQPQAAILTTESIVKRPVVIGEGIAVRDMMNMCLSFDHRIVDGMMAGQFLGAIKKRLEDWTASSIQL
jgi:2-oxoisovalerate dehydrogenase E2 component (dihydrolipoyl transacylase)